MDLNELKKRLSVAIETPQPSFVNSTNLRTPTTGTVDWDSLIDKYSQQYPDVPKHIIKGILEQESQGDANATGKPTKYGTAKGPFQFIDSTAQQYIPGWKSPEDSYDPEKATAGAFNYVSALLKETGGDVKKAVGRYFGTGYDPVAKMDTNDYAGQVIEKSQKYNDSGTSFVAKEQSVRSNTGFDMEGLKGRLGAAIAGGKTLESYQPPVNVVPQQQTAMQPITGMQKPVEQTAIEPTEKKQLPFVGNFVEMLKTMARTPISMLRGIGEGTMSAANKASMAYLDKAMSNLDDLKSKYPNGIPESDPIIKKVSADLVVPYETLKQAKNKNGNYDIGYLSVILEDAKKERTEFNPKDVTEPIKNIENLLKEKDVERLGGVGGVLQDLTAGVTQVAAQVGLNAVNPSLAATSMITLIGGSSIEELEKKGVDPMDGAALSLANAALQYPLEKIGLGKIVDNMAVKNATGKVLKRVVSSFLGEGITEGIQEIPDYILTDWFVKTKGMDLKEKIDTLVKDLPELGKRAGYSGVIGGLTGSAVTGAGIAIDQTINGKDRAEKKSIEDAWNKEMADTQQKVDSDPGLQRAMNAPDLTGTMQPIVDMQGYRDRLKAEQLQDDESIAGKIASEQQQPEVETPEGLKPEPEMKPITQQPEEDAGPQQVDATEEQINIGKTLAVNNGKVVFQKSAWGMKATNPNTGEKVDIKPKFEFKDKETNGNITMSLDEISSPDAENILETKILEQRKAFEEGEKFRKEKNLTPSSELDAQDKESKLKKEQLNAEAVKKEDSNKKSVRVDEGVSKRKSEGGEGEGTEISTISNSIADVPSVQPVTEKQEESTVSPDDEIVFKGKKKIWEQTRKEIEEERDRRVKWYKGEKKNVAYGTKWADKAEKSKLSKAAEEEKRYYDKILNESHKERIIEALADGEKVPDEVLKDYPDLKVKQEESTVSPASEQSYVKEKVDEKVVKIPVKETIPFSVKGSKHEFFVIKKKDGYDGKDTYDLVHKGTGVRLSTATKIEDLRDMINANSSSLGIEKFDEAIKNNIDRVKGEEVEASPEMADLYLKAGYHPRSYMDLETGIKDKNPDILEGILHLRNEKTRELFTAKTGVKLPGTMKGTIAAIRDFVGTENYDNIQKSSKEAALKREEEQKQKDYADAQNKELDAGVNYNGYKTTYRKIIDNHIADGWRVNVKQQGIRQIYSLTNGDISVRLPTKKVGEYADEQYLKKQEERDKEIESKIPESQKMTQEEEDHLFGKEKTPSPTIQRPEEQKAEIEAINTNPTEPQKEAGNYRKAHIKRDGFLLFRALNGMDIFIENAAGQERKGTDKTGKEWKVTMNHDYGYIRGTKGADAYRGRGTDQLDVFIKPYAPEGGDVFVVNQKDPATGKFDEHKVMVGFNNKVDALKGYLSNYEKGWKKNVKSIIRMPMNQFKQWAYSEDTKNELTQEIVDKYKIEQTGVTENKLEDTNNIKENTDEKEVSQKAETVLNEKVEAPSSESIEEPSVKGIKVGDEVSYNGKRGKVVQLDPSKGKIMITGGAEGNLNGTFSEQSVIEGSLKKVAPKKSVKERAQEKLKQKVAEENKNIEKKDEEPLENSYRKGDTIRIGKEGEPGTWEGKVISRNLNEENKTFYTVEDETGEIRIVYAKGKHKVSLVDKTTPKSQQEFTIAKDKAASAVDKMKKLLNSLEKRDPNTLYSIGTEQMEIGFEIVSDLVDAGIHTFKGMVNFIKENLPDALKNAEFKKVIEMSYDSYYEVAQEDGDNKFEKREQTVDNLSKEEGDGVNDNKRSRSALEEVEAKGISRNEQGKTTDEGTSSSKTEQGDGGKSRREGDESDRGTRDSRSTDNAPSARRGDRIDFVITDESKIGEGGSVGKANDTISAIRTLKKIESEGRTATVEEQAILAKFSGWGPLSGALNEEMSDVPFAMKKHSEELRKLLTPEEWETAKISRETSHFTSVPVIRSIWDTLKRMGFKGGKVLEPSIGVGSFIGLRPVDINMSVTGIEMDSLTSRFAKHLYQTSNINNQKFEEYTMPKDYYDVVISNVPFRDVPTYDKNAERYGIKNRVLSLHNFFFAKALYGTRPGGVVAFITTHNTLDATKNKEHLKYITEKGNILGAVRLPNTAFKGVAGTEVVTDIIFVQKAYPKESTRNPNNELFMQVGKVEGVGSKGKEAFAYINKYFIENPGMVVGENAFSGSMYGPDEYTVEPFESDFNQDLRKALNNIPSDIIDDGEMFKIKQSENIKVTPAPDDVMVGSFYELDGEIYIKVRDITQDFARGEKVTIQTKDKAKVKDLISIRNDARLLFKKQLGGNDDVTSDIKKLTKKYDDYVKKYGYFHTKENYRWIDQDVDMSILLALENYDPKTKTGTKGDLLTKPIAARPEKVTKTESVEDAYLLSLTEKGTLNIEYISELTGRDRGEVVNEMLSKKIIYEDPEIFNASKISDPSYIDRETYLSGNVRKKLKVAEVAAKEDSRFNSNVEDLRKVIPTDKGPGEIVLLPNNPVVQEQDIENFVKDILLGKRSYERVVVSHNRETGKHKIFYEGGNATNNNYGVTYTDTSNIAYTGTQLLELILNNNPITVTYTVKDGDSVRTVTDDKATQVAREKADKIRSEFKRWVWSDGERTDRLVRDFNDRYNCLVNRKYTHPKRIKDPKAKISLVGNVISLRPHQSDVVWRGIQNKNLLMAHEVGAGKTFACISLAMELKRLGLRKKSMVVVPNHIADSWGKSILQAYPGAKVLVSNETNFSATKRKEFINKAAFNDYDIIVMRYSHFKEISMNPQYEAEFIQERVEKLLDALAKQKEAEGKAGKGRRNATREEKNLQKRIDRYLGRVNELLSMKRDVGIPYFDEMGVDQIFVDEADNFKNLEYVSTIKGILGMGKQDGSKQAIDLQMKAKYIQRSGGGVVFATGTPISNSLVEAFHMMTFLQSEYLEENGISNFDEWQRLYAEPVTSFEQNASGTGLKQRTRFTKYNNVQELITTLADAWDIVDQQFLEENGILRTGYELPKVKRVIVESPINPYLADYMDHLAQRERDIANRKRPPEPGDDIVPVVTFHGKLASTALRAINKKAPFDKNEKLNKAIGKAKELYDKYQDKAGIIFYDMSAPSKKKSVGLEVLSYMKEQLISSGVKPEEIALIHDFKKKELEEKLYKPMREGKIRILIGNTQRMGAGTNVQDKLKWLFHIDAPYRPRDIIQREGRIIRQGNFNDEVEIYTFITKGSLDSGSWELLSRKAKMINSVMSGRDKKTNTIDEGDQFSDVSIAAILSPLMKDRADLNLEIKRTNALNESLQSDIFYAKRKVQSSGEKIKTIENKIKTINNIKEKIPENIDDKNFKVRIVNTIYNDKTEATEALDSLLKTIENSSSYLTNIKIGDFFGTPIEIDKINDGDNSKYYVKAIVDGYPNTFGNAKGSKGIMNHLTTTLKKWYVELIEDHKKAIQNIEEETKLANDTLKEDPNKYVKQLEEMNKRMLDLNAKIEEDQRRRQEERAQNASKIKSINWYELEAERGDKSVAGEDEKDIDDENETEEGGTVDDVNKVEPPAKEEEKKIFDVGNLVKPDQDIEIIDQKKYYNQKYHDGGLKFILIEDAKPVNIGQDVDAFVYNDKTRKKGDTWIVIESSSGQMFGHGATKNEAVEGAISAYTAAGAEKFKTVVRKNIESNSGLSPRYRIVEKKSMASSPLFEKKVYASAVPTFKITDLAKPVTPAPVKVNPVQTVKAAPSGKKLQYAQASSRLGNQISNEPKEVKDTNFLTPLEKITTNWFEDVFPLQKIEDIHDKDLGVSRDGAREMDKAVDAVLGSPGATHRYIDENLTPILREGTNGAKSPGEVYVELNKYLVAKRASWLYDNNPNFADIGINKDTANDFVEFIETGAHPHYDRIMKMANGIWQYEKELLKIKRDANILGDVAIAELDEPYYVPFYRDMETIKDAGKTQAGGQRYYTLSTGIKKGIKGSLTGKKVIDPIQSIQLQTYETIINANRNKCTNVLFKLAEESEEVKKYFTLIPDKWVKAGTIEYRMEADALLRPMLEDMAKNDYGLTVEYKTKLAARVKGRLEKVLGLYKDDALKTLVGSTEGTFAHELGHAIHEKTSWYRDFIKDNSTELNNVAATRYLNVPGIDKKFIDYVQTEEEKAAEFIAMYVIDREGLNKLAPKAMQEFGIKILSDNTMKKLIGMQPSNVKGIYSKTVDNVVQLHQVPRDADVISGFVDGKITSYRVPVEIADAVKNMDVVAIPEFIRILFTPINKIVRAGAVAYDVNFLASNPARDVQESAFKGRTIPIYDFIRGAYDVATNGEYLKEWERNYGSMNHAEAGNKGYLRNRDELKYGNPVLKYLDPEFWNEYKLLKGSAKAVFDVFKSPLEAIRAMSGALEAATRVGTYRRARRALPKGMQWYSGKPMDIEDAIRVSRDATNDFQRGGKYSKKMNSIIPFSNAAIRGMYTTYRYFRDDPKRALMGYFVYAIVPTLLQFLMTKDEEWYKAIKLKERLDNWIIPNPLSGREDLPKWLTGLYFTIPKGFWMQPVANPLQIALEKANGMLLKSNLTAYSQVIEDVDPYGISTPAIMMMNYMTSSYDNMPALKMLPVSIRMILDPALNYDFYWHKEIEAVWDKASSDRGQRYDKYTSESMKMIGKALNISPKMMQHEFELIGAGAGRNVLWLADYALGKRSDKGIDLDRVPIVRRFYGKIKEFSTDMDEDINLIDKQLRTMNDYRANFGKRKMNSDQLNKIEKSNTKVKELLYLKRRQLVDAKARALELLKNQE